MSVVGKSVRIYTSGAPVSLSAQSVRRGTGPQNIYQVDDVSRQVLDDSQRISIAVQGTVVYAQDNFGVPSPSNTEDWTINPLFGIITRNETGPHPIPGQVIVTGNYFPLVEVGQAREFSMSKTAELLDTTTFGDETITRKATGLKDVSVSITELEGVNAQDWAEYMDNDERILLDIRMMPADFTIYGTTPTIVNRGWFLPETLNYDNDVSDLVIKSIDLLIDASGNGFPFSTQKK